jgi:hypothetical protein
VAARCLLQVGQAISVLTPANRQVPLRVLGIVEEEFGILQDLAVALPLNRRPAAWCAWASAPSPRSSHDYARRG